MNRTFRLFISSTFSDFMLEREVLQARVFPRLEEYCASKGAKFLAVDLRWGITEAAQVEHDTLRICLDEIRRSQELSPRPNFAVLLGNRYGWEPIPARIPKDHWDRLLANSNTADQKTIRAAYYPKPDSNAIPPAYVLRYREGNWDSNQIAELTVRDALRRCAKSFKESEQLTYFASATHQEIVLGAMETPDAKQHVHVYVRTIQDLPWTEEAKAFIDWDAKTGALVPGGAERLKRLELELRAKLPGMIKDYSTVWLGPKDTNLIADVYLEDFCEQFYQDQKTLIDQELERLDKLEPYETRAKLHEDFAKERSENFVGRKPTLKVIDTYVESILSNSTKVVTPLIMHGEGGTGKSAIMAYAYRNIQACYSNAAVLARFIGGVPGCEDIGPLLRDLIEDICRIYQVPLPQEMNSTKELNEAFESVLNLASEDKPLILFLDAIDQLTNSESAWLLEWLPKELPCHTRMILTARQGPTLDNAQRRLPKSLKIVPAMSNADGAKMLDAWLGSFKEARFNAGIAPTIGRKLSNTQRRSVLEQFKNCPKPLWLKLVYEEVRTWRSWDEPRIFPNGIKSMVRELINVRLLKDDKHLPVFTHRALAYIAAGRFGLSEDEIAKALGSDKAVKKEFQDAEKTDKKWPSDSNQLPPILWSRLYFDLAPYLTNAQIDGAILFRYFHREFKEVIEEELLAGKAGEAIHAKLATMFSKMGDQNTDTLFRKTDAGGQQQSPALRRIMEEPWQLTKANQQEKLSKLLTNFGYCMAKCAANRYDDLLVSYLMSELSCTKSLENSAWLEVIQGNAHLLRRGEPAWPAHKILLQIANEHADDSAITIASEKWLKNGPCDWVWLKRKSRQHSLRSNSCLMVLQGHTAEVKGAQLLPDGRILSWSSDNSLRIWDSHSGATLVVLSGHTKIIVGAQLLSDGRILSWSEDQTLRIWDGLDGSVLEILEGNNRVVLGAQLLPDCRILEWLGFFGAQLLPDGRILSWSSDNSLRLLEGKSCDTLIVLEGHTSSIKGAQLLPDGRILSWSSDNSLRIWDSHSGATLVVLSGHTKIIVGAQLLSDGRILSWSEDRTLRIWDSNSGTALALLHGHTHWVKGAQLLPDGRILSWSSDSSLRIWDSHSGATLLVLSGHTGSVLGAQLLPDGRILSWSSDNSLRIWDTQSGVMLAVLEGHNDLIWDVQLLPDGRILSWSWDSTLRIWDSISGAPLALLYGHTNWVMGAQLLPDGRILSWSSDNSLRIWDGQNAGGLAAPQGQMQNVDDAKLLPDGRILSWSRDCILRIWDTRSGSLLASLEGHTATVRGAQLLPDGRILSWSFDHTLRVWGGQDDSEIVVLMGHTDAILGAQVMPDGRILSWSGNDHTLRIWDANNGAALAVLEGHTDKIRGVQLLPDGRILSWSFDKTLRVWDSHSGATLAVLKGHTQAVNGAQLLPDGRILSWSIDCTLRIWDCHNSATLTVLSGHTEMIIGAQLLDDGRIVSWSGWWSGDRIIRIWDAQSGTAIAILEGHTENIEGVKLLTDGRILSWSMDKTLRIWGAHAGELTAVLEGHTKEVSGAKLLPNESILSWSKDRTLRLWDSQSGLCLDAMDADWVETIGFPGQWPEFIQEAEWVCHVDSYYGQAISNRISISDSAQRFNSRWHATDDVRLLKADAGQMFAHVGSELIFLEAWYGNEQFPSIESLRIP